MTSPESIRLLACAFLVLSLASCGGSGNAPGGSPGDGEGLRVVVVGASIGYDWNLAGLPGRTGLPGVSVEFFPEYRFDKTETVEEVLMRPRRKFHPTKTYLKGFFLPSPRLPHYLVIKECPAYFPGNPEEQAALVRSWVQRIRGKGVRPVLATVTPVRPGREEKKPGQSRAIDAYNAWVVEYAAKEGIPVVDLAAPLREPGTQYLGAGYDSGDGLHLNRQGYAVLDQAFKDALRGLPAR